MEPLRQVIAVHGGAGGMASDRDGCEHAAHIGAGILASGGRAVDAAVQAVVYLEDDGRYNAGYGSALCMDGRGVEMDAAVMDSDGVLGAVACLRFIRNPVRAALAVADTPHWLLAGVGAERFARGRGLERRSGPSPQALLKHAKVVAALHADASGNAEAFHRDWNYAVPWHDAIASVGSGTVGAVAVDARGCFAVATSTGGGAPALLGRVGDTPIIGCGFFAGSMGAIAVTGVGEYIVRRLVARSVYETAVSRQSIESAIDSAIADFPPEIELGIIGISATEIIMRSNREMPCAAARQ